jgi:DNA mismatch repair protein MutS
MPKVAKSSADTPVMRQWAEQKALHPDAILFFRLGDFYEMFFDDAVVAAQALDLTLTSRDKNRDNPIPMCGVPHHAGKGYIGRLLELGHKVAICEQVEDPKTARGVVKRAVTEVVTPGVVVDADHLDARENNYLVAVVPQGKRAKRWGLAALDLSTAELRVTEVDDVVVVDELARLRPQQIVHLPTAADAVASLSEVIEAAWEEVPADLLPSDKAVRALVADKAGGELETLGMQERSFALRAACLALRYAERTQPGRGVPSCRLVFYEPSEHLQLDEPTLRNLEIFLTAMERKREGSLLSVIDETATAMGARLLRKQLALPLLDVAAIRRRQDAVELLAGEPELRQRLREALRRVYDLERLTSRTVLQVVTPRELARLGSSLALLPDLYALLEQARAKALSRELPELLAWPDDLLEDVSSRLALQLADEPPPHTREGGIFRRGANAELDELIDLCEGGQASILNMEAELRERTGISSLKVRYNKVFGYFIEVTKSNLGSVPADFQRKQTLVNAERFVTDELAEYEAKVLGAQERRHGLEQQLFDALRAEIACFAARLTACAERVALLDVLAGLAEVAQNFDYTRPEVDDSDVIEIAEGRHPVVERAMAVGQFVPNDVRVDREQRMLILTGPNMSGKSTIMRQVALITLLAQVGSFVPARRARIGVADRIFTRVGASDNLARGESTFMVEMRETSGILRSATARSLLVMDEIGRGTATYDGISIAWAVAEHLHDRVRARTLFATHYHELCQLTEVKAHARNFSVAVQEWQGRVVFLRKLTPGGSSRSYGIEVARLAGLPRKVLDRARLVLSALEGGAEVPDLPLRGRMVEPSRDQLTLFGAPAPESLVGEGTRMIERELRALDVNRLTPIEALNLLSTLVARLEGDDLDAD